MGGFFFIQDFRSNDFIQTTSKMKIRSKQNTCHVMNKNIAPGKVYDGFEDERGDAFWGIPKLRCLSLP